MDNGEPPPLDKPGSGGHFGAIRNLLKQDCFLQKEARVGVNALLQRIASF